jgi:hypothetical protein
MFLMLRSRLHVLCICLHVFWLGLRDVVPAAISWHIHKPVKLVQFLLTSCRQQMTRWYVADTSTQKIVFNVWAAPPDGRDYFVRAEYFGKSDGKTKLSIIIKMTETKSYFIHL